VLTTKVPLRSRAQKSLTIGAKCTHDAALGYMRNPEQQHDGHAPLYESDGPNHRAGLPPICGGSSFGCCRNCLICSGDNGLQPLRQVGVGLPWLPLAHAEPGRSSSSNAITVTAGLSSAHLR